MNSDDRKRALDADVLAGFIDGTLSSEERARVIEALDEDEDAFELFSETLSNILAVEASPTHTGPGEREFSIASRPTVAAIGTQSAGRSTGSGPSNLDATGGMDDGPAARPASRTVSRWLPAAAICFVVLGGLIAYQFLGGTPIRIELDELVAEASGADASGQLGSAWWDHGWPGTRGSSADLEGESRAFRLGVLVVDLHVALEARETEGAEAITHSLEGLLGTIDLAEPLVRSYEELRSGLPSGNYPRLSALNASTARLIEGRVDATAFRFGQWAEASRLASRLRNGAYFGRSDFQGELDLFAKNAEATQRAPLERLRALTRAGPGQERLDRIQEILETVVRRGGTDHGS